MGLFIHSANASYEKSHCFNILVDMSPLEALSLFNSLMIVFTSLIETSGNAK